MKGIKGFWAWGTIISQLAFTGYVGAHPETCKNENSLENIKEGLKIEANSDVVVLSKEQALQIMRVLEQIVTIYEQDGSLDLASDGARAALSCCAQLDEVVQCLLLLKAGLNSTESQITVNQVTLVSILDVNQVTLVSLLEVLIGCACT